MSRHRAVRNLDLEDVLDEDQLENEDYDENQLDESQLSNEDLDALEDGLDYVYGVIGQDVPLTDIEIKEALWYYYFDKEETVNWALEKLASIKADQEKQKAKDAKKLVTGNKATRKPCYRRPPSRMFMESVQQILPAELLVAESTTKVSSLSQLAGRGKPSSPLANLRSTTGSKNTLSSLVAKSTNSASSTTKTVSNPSNKNGTTSLLSLAQKSAGQRNMSALQNLASRQKPSSPTSLSPLSKQTSTNTTSSNSEKQQPNSLAHLASRSRTTNPASPSALTSLALASSSSSKKTSAIFESAKKSIESYNTSASPSVKTKDDKEIDQGAKTLAQPIRKTASLATATFNEGRFNDMISQATKKTTNPLIAPPSPAAVFLFQPHEQKSSPLSVDINMALPNSLAQAFYETMSLSSMSKAKLFKFDAPSPDDIVMAAQSQRGSNKNKKIDPPV